MFDMKFIYFNVYFSKFNVYSVLSFSVTCLFGFHCSGVYAMGGGLKGITSYKRKYETSLNSCNGTPSLEEAWKPAVVSSMASNNSGIECRNYILTETNESDYGSVKTSSP